VATVVISHLWPQSCNISPFCYDKWNLVAEIPIKKSFKNSVPTSLKDPFPGCKAAGGLKLNTHLQLRASSRMSGDVLLLLLYASMVCTQANLSFSTLQKYTAFPFQKPHVL